MHITPIPRSKGQARQYYNRISGIYDWLTISEKPLIQQGVETLNPQAGECILEIGCGTGRALAALQKTVGDSEIFLGLDLSHHMLLRSQKNSEASLIQGDAIKLPLLSRGFAGVFCAFTLELFPEDEIPVVLQNIRRVLNPGERLMAIALSAKPEDPAVKLYEFAHKLFPVAVDCRPIPIERILIENNFRVQSLNLFMNWGLPIKQIASTPIYIGHERTF